ncbi:hypothetical protein [Streptomyces sp. TS71-3]|uniref:hypothetical protein n=1 Tax=Streptomyces sp. TS71-3 TaxID=2733862 RepID=UPI001BB3993C|nr:hypothetical protein [Streptomyces sp. TS71-3]
MKPDDALAALDDIRKRQEQSGMAELEYGLSRFYLLLAAVLLFAAFASYDLPNPWGGAVLFPGVVLLALMAFTYVFRAPVRGRPGTAAWLVAVVCGLVVVGAFRGLAAAFGAGGVPVPHLIAGVVVVGACLLVAPPARRAAEARVRRRRSGGADGQRLR